MIEQPSEEYISDWCDRWAERLAEQWLQFGTDFEGLDLLSEYTWEPLDRCPAALWSWDSENKLITRFRRGIGWQVRVDMDTVLRVYDAIKPRGVLPDLQQWCIYSVDSCIRDHAAQIIEAVWTDGDEIETWYVPKQERV